MKKKEDPNLCRQRLFLAFLVELIWVQSSFAFVDHGRSAFRRHHSLASQPPVISESDGSVASSSVTSNNKTSSCPIQTTLNVVPRVPIIGSFFPPLTGIPTPDRKFPNRFNVLMNELFGDFYRMTIPTIGKDIEPDLYVLTDPNEMRKVVQSKATADADPKYQYPVGIVEQQWPFYEYLCRHAATTANIFTRGSQWWESRQVLQAALATPPLEAIVQGAQMGGRRLSLEASSSDWQTLPETFQTQLNRAAFDMFEQVLFGADDPESTQLFASVLAAMLQAQDLRRSPWQSVVRNWGVVTSEMRACYDQLDAAMTILNRRAKETLARRDDEVSCVVQSLQAEYHMPEREIPYACLAMFLGSVDTTAGVIAWNLLQLAYHPQAQEALHEEIVQMAGTDNGITTDVLDKLQTPWLHGVVRETHRLTPAVTVNLIKDALCPVSIHGEEFPPRTAFMFDSTTPQLQNVPDSYTYDPARWLPQAVQERQQQFQEEDSSTSPNLLLDHPYFAQPFGQGLRRCPGAAIASAEVHAFLAQFVLDWQVRIVGEDPSSYRDVPSLMNAGPIPDFPKQMQIRRRWRCRATCNCLLPWRATCLVEGKCIV